LGVAIFTNTESGGGAFFSAINNLIVDSYLGLPKLDWITTYYNRNLQNKGYADSVTNATWQKVAQNKTVKINHADYLGTYQDNWFGKAEVFLKNGELWFKCLRSPKLNGKMYFYNANTFAIKWEYTDMPCDAFAMFQLNENGKAQGIKLKGISPSIDFSFDFQDLDFKRLE
jgi:hypothetical protein